MQSYVNNMIAKLFFFFLFANILLTFVLSYCEIQALLNIKILYFAFITMTPKHIKIPSDWIVVGDL